MRDISDEVWARKPDATVVVYPHYFSGAKLRFAFARPPRRSSRSTRAGRCSSRRTARRWNRRSSPRARGAWWWNEAPSRFDVASIRAGAKKARDAKCSGYVPSLECYSYVPTKDEFGEPWLTGRRQIPFGFGWLKDGENPYRELPVRAIRLAWRELTANPDLPDAELRTRLGRELFGADWQPAQVDDLFDFFSKSSTLTATGPSPARSRVPASSAAAPTAASSTQKSALNSATNSPASAPSPCAIATPRRREQRNFIASRNGWRTNGRRSTKQC